MKSIYALPMEDPHSPTGCLLDWIDNWDLDEGFLSRQFKVAGDHVVQQLQTGETLGHADGLFMPVAYLYRHSLELKLKHIVRLGITATLLEHTEEIDRALGSHNLDGLWRHARPAIVARWPDADTAVLDNAEVLIHDFHRIDTSGQNLRYARDLRQRPTTQAYPDSIDLAAFRRAFEAVHNLLDGCAFGFDEAIDDLSEAPREG